MWSYIRERWWTSWWSDGYDAGTCLTGVSSSRTPGQEAEGSANSNKLSLSPELSVSHQQLPLQCQDFLSGQEMGGGRKWCMSTWSPLAVMSYATANRSQCRLNLHRSALRRSLYFNGEKKRKQIYKIWDLFCNIITILMIMIINILN